MKEISTLPGGELVQRGLADYAAGLVTQASCLVAIGWPRLKRAGLDLPEAASGTFPQPEIQLYQLLGGEPGDAYSRYNSLLRRLISFEQSLERQNSVAALQLRKL